MELYAIYLKFQDAKNQLAKLWSTRQKALVNSPLAKNYWSNSKFAKYYLYFFKKDLDLFVFSPQPTLWLKAIAILVSARPSVRPSVNNYLVNTLKAAILHQSQLYLAYS